MTRVSFSLTGTARRPHPAFGCDRVRARAGRIRRRPHLRAHDAAPSVTTDHNLGSGYVIFAELETACEVTIEQCRVDAGGARVICMAMLTLSTL